MSLDLPNNGEVVMKSLYEVIRLFGVNNDSKELVEFADDLSKLGPQARARVCEGVALKDLVTNVAIVLNSLDSVAKEKLLKDHKKAISILRVEK